MNYQYDYSVIGGDVRQVYLAEELAQHTNRICCFALCSSPNERHCSSVSSVYEAASLTESCSASPCIVCPIPFSRNGPFLNQSAFDENLSIYQLLSNLRPGQSFFAGCIPDDFKTTAEEIGVHIFDLMSDPSLSLFNTIATAEGAICEAIKRSPINLHQSSCAILGYGRCGRTLSHYLKGMFCNICVVSRQAEECAQAALIADKTGTLQDFESYVDEFDFIFNTIPSMVVPSRLLEKMKSSVTIIDIASAPGGVDFNAARELGISAVLCPGLPGKYAPVSSARAVKETIEKIKDGKEF